jgi:hypothetical protein
MELVRSMMVKLKGMRMTNAMLLARNMTMISTLTTEVVRMMTLLKRNIAKSIEKDMVNANE